MKPTKKKNATDVQKVLTVAPKMQNYFKSAPKQFVVEKESQTVTDHNQAKYVQVVKDKLESLNDENNSFGEDGAVGYDSSARNDRSVAVPHINPKDVTSITTSACLRSECVQKNVDYNVLVNRLNDLELEHGTLQAKHKELKKTYFTTTSQYTELDIKYQALLKAKSNLIREDNGDNAIPADDFITKNQLKFLECMPLEKKRDSTFILQCLEFMYKSDLSVLRGKTLKGTTESTKINADGTSTQIPAKEALTPAKVARIKELFFERISKCSIDSSAFIERVGEANVNKLIACGVKNVVKKIH